MKYNGSCKGISIWEDLCMSGLKSGIVTLAHDGKSKDNDSCYTRKYNVHLKSTLHPAEIKFTYDNREGVDKASVKITLSDLVLILQALANREFTFDASKFTVSMDRDDGFVITEK